MIVIYIGSYPFVLIYNFFFGMLFCWLYDTEISSSIVLYVYLKDKKKRRHLQMGFNKVEPLSGLISEKLLTLLAVWTFNTKQYRNTQPFRCLRTDKQNQFICINIVLVRRSCYFPVRPDSTLQLYRYANTNQNVHMLKSVYVKQQTTEK